MNYLEAVLLGIIQGITEFLPISSSGHIEIAKALFGNEAVGEEGLFLTLVLHLGTALSTIIVFRKEIQEMTWEKHNLNNWKKHFANCIDKTIEKFKKSTSNLNEFMI